MCIIGLGGWTPLIIADKMYLINLNMETVLN